MYTLVRELDRMDNNLLWLCLVGVTDQYLRAHISDLFYASCYAELTTCVESLNLQNGAVGTIQQSFEPRFLLFRFWSLYESMVHSDFLVARLQLTHSASTAHCEDSLPDRIRVNELLTRIGVSLKESKEP